MNFLVFHPAHSVLLAACLWTAAQAGPAAFAKLEALQGSAETAGTLVYRGDTFVQRAPVGAPLFRYERRVLTNPNGLTASHITRDPGGRVIIAESAQVSPSYETQRFEATNQ